MTDAAELKPTSNEAELEKIVERVQKLLALGRRGGSEAESAAAMAKAQAMLAQHNLDMASVESAQAGSGAREKNAQRGGTYLYQRCLWNAVAELNFCLYFTDYQYIKVAKKLQYTGHTYLHQQLQRQHLVVGRKVNTRATIVMATYLEGTADRLCRERLETRSGTGTTPGHLNAQFFTSWAVAFREGVCDRMIEKIEARRAKLTKEQDAAAAKARRAAEAKGVSTETALSLTIYQDKETDANNDFLYGEGTSAKWAADRAERAAEAAREEAEYTAWAEVHPEEARAAEEKARKEREVSRSRRRTSAGPSRKVNGAGYWAGHEAGEKVGIDPQAGSDDTKQIGRR